VGPRAGLDGCGKSRPPGIRSSDRPARSESPYRLSYPIPKITSIALNTIVLLHFFGIIMLCFEVTLKTACRLLHGIYVTIVSLIIPPLQTPGSCVLAAQDNIWLVSSN
jgi:hypothetical protein